jgi:thiol-disulfide isomerase/thioredoxin
MLSLLCPSWCPACKSFTPLLSVLYEEAQEEGIDFEVIYVSSDDSAEQSHQYMKEKHGDWLRIPFHKTASLKTKFGVFAGKEQSLFQSTKRRSGIPTLVIVNNEGKELEMLDCDDSGVIRDIESKGSAFLNRWESLQW